MLRGSQVMKKTRLTPNFEISESEHIRYQKYQKSEISESDIRICTYKNQKSDMIINKYKISEISESEISESAYLRTSGVTHQQTVCFLPACHLASSPLRVQPDDDDDDDDDDDFYDDDGESSSSLYLEDNLCKVTIGDCWVS